jgi:hypothetical protein
MIWQQQTYELVAQRGLNVLHDACLVITEPWNVLQEVSDCLLARLITKCASLASQHH